LFILHFAQKVHSIYPRRSMFSVVYIQIVKYSHNILTHKILNITMTPFFNVDGTPVKFWTEWPKTKELKIYFLFFCIWLRFHQISFFWWSKSLKNVNQKWVLSSVVKNKLNSLSLSYPNFFSHIRILSLSHGIRWDKLGISHHTLTARIARYYRRKFIKMPQTTKNIFLFWVSDFVHVRSLSKNA